MRGRARAYVSRGGDAEKNANLVGAGESVKPKAESRMRSETSISALSISSALAKTVIPIPSLGKKAMCVESPGSPPE